MKPGDHSHLFSVFVGHMSQETKRKDIMDLFSGCGVIEELFIVANEHAGSSYNYGFVRFTEMESAIKAVKDLHRWPLKGSRLVVDLSKDTYERIQKQKEFGLDVIMQPKKKVQIDEHREEKPHRMKTTDHARDVLYLSRVKEACLTANHSVQNDDDQTLYPIDVQALMEEIATAEEGSVPSKDGCLPEAIGAEKIKEKLLYGATSAEVGREKVKDFVGALHNVMNTMMTFLTSNGQDTSGFMNGFESQLSDSLEEMSTDSSDRKSDPEPNLSRSLSGSYTSQSDDASYNPGPSSSQLGCSQSHGPYPCADSGPLKSYNASYTSPSHDPYSCTDSGLSKSYDTGYTSPSHDPYSCTDSGPSKSYNTGYTSPSLDQCTDSGLSHSSSISPSYDHDKQSGPSSAHQQISPHNGTTLHRQSVDFPAFYLQQLNIANKLNQNHNVTSRGDNSIAEQNGKSHPPSDGQALDSSSQGPVTANDQSCCDTGPKGAANDDLLQSATLKNYFVKAIAGRGRGFNKEDAMMEFYRGRRRFLPM